MTHGHLEITDFHGNVIHLHTWHTGMDIPLAVEKAIKVLADYTYYIKDGNPQDVLESFRSNIANDRLRYANCTAALIICAIPAFLEPICENLKDMKQRGIKHWLHILENAWVLERETDGGRETLLSIDPSWILAELIANNNRNKNESSPA